MTRAAERDDGASTSSPRTQTRTEVSTTVITGLPQRARRPVVEVGATFELLFQVVGTAVRNPTGYWRDTLQEMYAMFRFCWLPVTMAVGGFCFLIGNYAYNFLRLAGAANREGTFFVFATAREISPFCTGMAVAGVMGTAMCADLGARKIREELDAMKILGVDIVRTLVLPRVISIVMMMAAFNLVGIALGSIMALISASAVGDTSPGSYFALLLANFTAPEIAGTTIKVILIGLFIGLVCAQKGLNAQGGPEGVGRGVNEAVVLCFAAVWIFNYIVNAIMLGLYPEILINR